jgi:hypothetical protein
MSFEETRGLFSCKDAVKWWKEVVRGMKLKATAHSFGTLIAMLRVTCRGF